MSSWTPNEMARVAAADEVQISPLRRDGTLRPPTTIWVVSHGDDLYVRAAYGPRSAWYRATRARHQGHIRAGGIQRDVAFTDIAAADPVNEQIDNAYRSKYRRYGATYVDMMLTPTARATTLKLSAR